MKTIQKGFTLIELMIVVAIVGILAAIALPAYQDYIARAKISEPLAKLDELKLGVTEYVASNNATPIDGTEAGLGGNGIVLAGTGTTPGDLRPIRRCRGSGARGPGRRRTVRCALRASRRRWRYRGSDCRASKTDWRRPTRPWSCSR